MEPGALHLSSATSLARLTQPPSQGRTRDTGRPGSVGPRRGSWDVSAIREILRNPVYRGDRTYGRIQKVRTEKGTRSKRSKPREDWVTKEAAHPPIVSQELWDPVQRRLRQVAETYQRSGQRMGSFQGEHSQYLLSTVLRCSSCGGHFVGRPGAKRRDGSRSYYYGCVWNARRRTSVCRNSALLPREAIEREPLELLLQSVLTPATVGRLLQAVNARFGQRKDRSVGSHHAAPTSFLSRSSRFRSRVSCMKRRANMAIEQYMA